MFKNWSNSPLDAVEADGALYITDGHHRAAAAARAGVKEVPVRVRPPHTPEEAIQLFRDFVGTLNDRGF
jgi:filamentous hemagglutinin